MRRQTSYIFGIALFFSLWMSSVFAQTAAIQGHSFLGGVSATTQGLNSTNYLNGIIPSATITVYLTGTTTKATIYKDGSETPLANPFTSNTVGSVNPGGWIFWAAINQGYDIVMSGGIPPNVYAKPVTLVDQFPGFEFSGGGCAAISSGGNCVTNNPTVTQTIVQPNATQFAYVDPNGNGTTFTASATSPLIYSQASRDGSFTHSDNWVSASITPFSQLGQAGFDILTYPAASTTYNPAYQHQYDFDNNGAYFYTDSFQVQTDPGGDITFNPGIQSTGPGSTTASSSIELGGNITVAGGNNGTCGSGGNFCTTTTMSWTNNSYGAGYNTISLNASSGAFTVTLPPAAGPSAPLDTILWFFKADATTNAITLAAASGDTVNGLSSISLSTPYQLIQLTSNGTHSWYVMGMGGSGSGTVTTVSVASANGFAGTVANPTTTPAITLSTTASGPLKGNGTAISAAAYADIVGLWASGSCSGYLKSDGTCATPSGGISGSGTSGYLPAWTSASAIGNSHLDDGVTTASTITSTEPIAVAVSGGQGGTFNATEGTAAAAAAGHDILYADSTAHCMEYSANGGAFSCLGAGSGTVTSVAMTMPGVLFNTTVSGSPITSSGTLAPALLTQSANTVFAGPSSGGAVTPTFRALVVADSPLTVRTRDFGTTFGDTTGSALTAGSVVYFTVPYACTIAAWNMAVDAGTATVDVWKIASGTAIPTVANTITASALPAISTGTAIHSTTLTGWTTSVAANDIFGIQLKTVATAKFVEIDLQCNQ